jgi:Anti-sigma factor NepR
MNTRKPSRRRTAMDLQGPESNPVAKLGPDIKAKIGQQLRLMYGEVLNQGVPDRFVEILQGLDDSTDGGSKNESA